MPRIGDSPKCLGVRLPPNPNPDILVDANGEVHPATNSGLGGMSCAPSFRIFHVTGVQRSGAEPKIKRPSWCGESMKRTSVFKVSGFTSSLNGT